MLVAPNEMSYPACRACVRGARVPAAARGARHPLGFFKKRRCRMCRLSLRILAFAVLASFGSSTSQAQSDMSFFVTSVGPGDGGNLGGLVGADKHCQNLAAAAGAGNRTWHAYLSTSASGGQTAVNARDRIGQGPWYNAKGVRIAENVADLHGDKNNLTKQTALTEKGEVVNGRGDQPNRHDILTGSKPDGTAFTGSEDMTCGNWT